MTFDPSTYGADPAQPVAPKFDPATYGQPEAPAPTAPDAPAAGDRGFFAKAWDSIKSGVHAVKHVGGDVIDTHGRALLDPAKRHELERGIGDVVTLGYGNRLAARVGNALGDVARGTSLNETQHFSADPTQGNVTAPSEVESREAAAAPEYRAAGQVAGTLLPNPVSKIVGPLAGKVVSKAAAPLAGAFAKATSAAAKVPGLAPIVAGAGAAAGGVANYELTAPLASALGAGAEGHRLEAAEQAATDPAGLLLSGAPPALAAYLKTPGVAQRIVDKVMSSKGAEARKFIEEHGEGAKVSPLTPGKGGIFEDRLKDVPSNDRGVGIAAKKGAVEVADAIERQFEEDHGFPYRGAPEEIKTALERFRNSAKDAQEGKRAASDSYNENLSAAKSLVRDTTAAKAHEILGSIEEDHRVETSRPYKVLKEQIDNSPAAAKPRDVTELVTHMQNAVHDLETAPFVRGALTDELKILDRYRDPQTDAILVPERQLNGLRRSLMRSAKIGMSDAPGEAEAPLRKAAFIAKQMVDEGPYEALNKLYAEGSAKREGARKAVGLSGKPARDTAADEKRLTANLRRTISDPTAIPGPNPAAEDVDAARAILALPAAQKQAALQRISSGIREAEAAKTARVGEVQAATKAAEPDRALLGLNAKIGTRKTDVNQIRLALERQVANSNTGGGNPADLEAFRKAHPEQARSLDLPRLQAAKNELGFGILPQHGGMVHRIASAAAGPLAAAVASVAGGHVGPKEIAIASAALAYHNRHAIQGRILAPIAKGYRKYAAGIVAAAGTVGGDVPGAIQRAVAAGIPPRVAQRMAEISRQTFLSQSQQDSTTADASP